MSERFGKLVINQKTYKLEYESYTPGLEDDPQIVYNAQATIYGEQFAQNVSDYRPPEKQANVSKSYSKSTYHYDPGDDGKLKASGK